MAGAPALPAHALESYEGLAYAPGTKHLLYRESHWVDGDERIVLYRCPGGEPFARKRVNSRISAIAPDFELTDARDGYREGVASIGGQREVFLRANNDSRMKRKTLTASNPVIDAGFDAFIRTSWAEISDKHFLQVPFVIPSRLGALNFKVRHAGDHGASRTFRLSLDGWYGALLPHIDVIYAATTRTLLRYRGISNIRGDDGRQLAVDIHFPAARRNSNVARSEADAAIAAQLVRRCPG